MDPTPLPSGFWLALAGVVLTGAIALAALWCLLRRARRRRVRALRTDQGGSTIVEFPFALIVLVLCALLTWQLGFLVSAYLLVDYAAFATVRSAVVVIPEKASDDEPHHVLADIGLDQDGKGDDIREAAVFVCYPISAAAAAASAASLLGANPIAAEVLKVPGADQVLQGLGQLDFALRYVYALENTSARIVVADQDSGERTFAGGQVVTVEVTHDFSLRVPIAARVFSQSEGPEGYKTAVTAHASMLYEGFAEKVPPGAEEVDG